VTRRRWRTAATLGGYSLILAAAAALWSCRHRAPEPPRVVYTPARCLSAADAPPAPPGRDAVAGPEQGCSAPQGCVKPRSDGWKERGQSVARLSTAAVLAGWLPLAAHAQPPGPVWDPAAMAAGSRVAAGPTENSATPTVPDPTTDLGGYAAAVLDAIRGGRWLVTFGLLLVGLVALAPMGPCQGGPVVRH